MFPELPVWALAARIEIVAAALATACEQAVDGRRPLHETVDAADVSLG